MSKHRGKLTIEDIFTVESVLVSSTKCSKGFMHKRDTQKFMKRQLHNSYVLCEKVLSGTYRPSYYKTRQIIERGKVREIKPPKFECKVVQKVLCDYVLRPLLEPKMISTNYASVKGKGTHRMYDDITKALRSVKNTDYTIIKTDFKGYFASIDLAILRQNLNKIIDDDRVVDLILQFSPVELTLGNEISQVPASWFPSPIDHTLKDKLRFKFYRYMDDTLAIVPNERVDEYIQTFTEESDKLNLVIKKIDTIPYGKNFEFCKTRYRYNDGYFSLINPSIVSKERKKLTSFKNINIPIQEIENQYRCVRGVISSFSNSYNICKELDKHYDRLFAA